MKTAFILFFIIVLFGTYANAGLPPTSSQGSGDSTDITTFKFRFPNITVSHSGSTATFNTVNVAGGGTGATSLTANNVILGNGTSAVQFVAPGTSGNVLKSNGTTWTAGVATTLSVAILKDIKAAATGGGSSVVGYQTRALNSEDDPDSIVTLASNQFTLQAGTYLIEADAPAYKAARHNIRLRNITDSTTDIVGSSEYQIVTNEVQTRSFLRGRVTLASAKTFEIQHYIGSALATIGLGLDSGSGDSSVFTQVVIIRLL